MKYDLNEVRRIKGKEPAHLPHVMKGKPQTKKPVILKDFIALPQHIKYTSCNKYKDIDEMRTRLRKNDIEHMKFEARLGGAEGKTYFAPVYSTTYKNEEFKEKDEHEEQQFFYCSVNANDLEKKDEQLKVTKPLDWKDPNEIELDYNYTAREKYFKDKEENEAKAAASAGAADGTGSRHDASPAAAIVREASKSKSHEKAMSSDEE